MADEGGDRGDAGCEPTWAGAGAGAGAGAVRPKRNLLTPAKKQRFLDVLAATASAPRAAAAAGSGLSSFYQHRYRNEAFAEAWREALESAMVRLEGEVLAHALGEAEGQIGDAERAGAAGRIDVGLAMELLKRRGGSSTGRTVSDRPSNRRASIAEVQQVLLARLAAMARRDGRE